MTHSQRILRNTVIAFGALALLVLGSLKARSLYQFVKGLDFDVDNISDFRLSGGIPNGSVSFNITLAVANPTPESVSITSVSARAYAPDGTFLASHSAHNLLIAPNAITYHVVPVSITLRNAWSLLGGSLDQVVFNTEKLVEGKPIGKSLRLDVDIVAEGITVPSQTTQIEI